MNTEKNIQEIPIEDIIPNRFQPRLAFNAEGINELAESIKQHGIIQPLVVRALGDKYEIIAGERRYKAATMAGLTKVPVIVSDIDDNKSAEVALVENIQRRNLTAIEEAKSYKNLLDRGYLTQEQLASKMGVSQSSIANKLRLLNLDEEVQEALLNEKISERHARALLSIENKEEQKKWLQRIINERLTVRQLDVELKKAQAGEGEEDEGIPLVNINPDINEIVQNAEDINVERELHDVASMLIPEGGVKEEPKEQKPATPEKMPNKFFNFLEDEEANMDVIEPEEILNTTFNTSVPPIAPEPIQNEKVEPVEQTTTPDENIELLDEPINLANETIKEELIPTVEEPKMEEISTPDIPSNLGIEPTLIKDDADDFNIVEPLPMAEPPMNPEIEEPAIPVIPPIEENTITPVDNEIINNEPSMNNEIIDNDIVFSEPILKDPTTQAEEITPFKSIFFNTEEDKPNEEAQPEISPNMNNAIEEVIPVVEEPLVDPMDSIVKIEPDYEERQKELAGTDLKTAINVVRDTVSDLENRGFEVEAEEADLEDIYHITIKIKKN